MATARRTTGGSRVVSSTSATTRLIGTSRPGTVSHVTAAARTVHPAAPCASHTMLRARIAKQRALTAQQLSPARPLLCPTVAGERTAIIHDSPLTHSQATVRAPSHRRSTHACTTLRMPDPPFTTHRPLTHRSNQPFHISSRTQPAAAGSGRLGARVSCKDARGV